MFKSCLLIFCWRKKKQLFWCYDLPTLHWVSSSPHSANRRWTKVRRGDSDNSCVHVYSRTFKNVFCFFHSICKMYLPYSGFYCGIIQSGIIIQYCTILFQLLTKKKKVWEKKLKTKVRKKKTENLKSIKKRTVAIDSCRRTSDAYINFTEKHKGRNGWWFQRCLFSFFYFENRLLFTSISFVQGNRIEIC